MKRLLLYILLGFCSIGYGHDFTRLGISTEADINKIFFYDNAIGWAVTTNGELLSTYTGGIKWTIKKITGRSINDIGFKEKWGYLVGNRGLVMKSINRGTHWKDMSLGVKYNFTGVGIIDDTSVIVCGTNQNSIAKTRGELFRTTSSGRYWKRLKHYGNGYADLAVVPEAKVFLLASKKTLCSINYGNSFWSSKYKGIKTASGFDFIDSSGYMVGPKGYFARTTDQGQTWQQMEINVDKDLYDIAMIDKSSGVAVGRDGTIVFFEKDGEEITAVPSGVETDLLTVAVTDFYIFCGGEKGTLLSAEREVNSEE